MHKRKNTEVEDIQNNIQRIWMFRCCCRWCLNIEIYLYSYDIFSVNVFMQLIVFFITINDKHVAFSPL